MPNTSESAAPPPKPAKAPITEEEYLAKEEKDFLNPLDTLERWADIARLLHESFKGRAGEHTYLHLTPDQLRERLRDRRGEDVSEKTISRLLTSFAVRIREQEAVRNNEDVRATRSKTGKLKHPELPRDSHGGYYLRPDQNPVPILILNDEEARTLLFALRYLLHNATEQQPALISLLEQMATHFSGVVGAVATKTIAQARVIDGAKPSNHPQFRYEVLERLTRAWLERGMVGLSYESPWSLDDRDWEPADFRRGCFQPVLLEPSRATGGTYAVGWLVTDGLPKLTTLKLDRIAEVQSHPSGCRKTHPQQRDERGWEEQAVFWLDDLDESWSGVLAGERAYDVEIRFSGDAAIRVREAPWRGNVTISAREANGSRTMVGTFTHYLDMVPWVLGWGAGAEVISPPELRDEVAKRLREAAAIYS